MILVAGPYRSGTGDDPDLIATNHRVIQQACLELFRAGHLAVNGEDLALPLAELAGSTRVGTPRSTRCSTPWDGGWWPGSTPSCDCRAPRLGPTRWSPWPAPAEPRSTRASTRCRRWRGD